MRRWSPPPPARPSTRRRVEAAHAVVDQPVRASLYYAEHEDGPLEPVGPGDGKIPGLPRILPQMLPEQVHAGDAGARVATFELGGKEICLAPMFVRERLQGALAVVSELRLDHPAQESLATLASEVCARAAEHRRHRGGRTPALRGAPELADQELIRCDLRRRPGLDDPLRQPLDRVDLRLRPRQPVREVPRRARPRGRGFAHAGLRRLGGRATRRPAGLDRVPRAPRPGPLAGCRSAGHQPARRRGDRGDRAERARHQRAQGVRGRARAPGLPRRAHEPAQPRPVPRPRRPRARRPAPPARAGGRPVHGRGRLQERQRLARPRRRRQGPAGGEPPAGGLHAPGRHRRPSRRRRVRRPDPRGREGDAGGRDRPAGDGVAVGPDLARGPRRDDRHQHRHRLQRPGHGQRPRRRGPAPQRRHGDVHGEGKRQGPLPDLPARHARPRARSPGAQDRPPTGARLRRVHAPLPADHGPPPRRHRRHGGARALAAPDPRAWCSRTTSSRCSRTPA